MADGPSMPPFFIEPLADGTAILRAFSDDSEDPIELPIREPDARRLTAALDEAMARMDRGERDGEIDSFAVGDATVSLALNERGMRLRVTR